MDNGDIIIAPEKKKMNVLAITLGVSTLVFAGLAVFFGVRFFTGESIGKSSVVKEEELVEIDIASLPEETAKSITANTMAENYQEVYRLVESLISDVDNLSNFENSSGIAYKPEGLNSYVPTKLAVMGKISAHYNSIDADFSAIKSRLANAGFESMGVLPHLGSAGPTFDGYINDDRNIICDVYEENDWQTEYRYNYVVLRCAKTDWTWLTAEEMALVQELEAAYYAKTGEYPTIIYDFDAEIQDSQYKPYQIVEVSIGGGRGSFYRTSPDAEWQYFAVFQAPRGCDEYNTEDLKKAYADRVCYNSGVESVVQP